MHFLDLGVVTVFIPFKGSVGIRRIREAGLTCYFYVLLSVRFVVPVDLHSVLYRVTFCITLYTHFISNFMYDECIAIDIATL